MGRAAGKGGILRFIPSFPSLDDRRRSRLILLLALLNGLLYLFIVPPWQHYDEPGHFEYAWLIANRGVLPESGDYDPAMRREVAASMVEQGFFHGTDFTPNLLAIDQPVWIGPTQVGTDPALYYLLVALPLRLVRFADMAVQLRVARAVSLLLYLVSVWLAGRIVAELVAEGHVLRWAVPGMMALLPAYTDLMTAVNNDVGATVMFSLFLWGAVRMIRHGFSWPRLVWVVGSAVLCVWTKSTAAVALLLAPLAVVLAVIRGPRQWLVWVGFGAAGVALVATAVGWGDAALWYRRTDQEVSTRQERTEAPLGEAALALEMTPNKPGRSLAQPLLQADVEALRGQTVTLGAWIWASEPVQVRPPMLDDGRQASWEPIEVGAGPVFYAITATVAAEAEDVEIVLRPLVDRTLAQTVTVWYDGVVLVEGARPLDQPPLFDGPEGREGTWGGEFFVNRIRNGSAEAAWPRVRGWVERGGRELLRQSPSRVLASVLDWERTGSVYPLVLRHLLSTFWTRFGWSQVRMSVFWFWACSGWTALALLGAFGSSWRRLRVWLREGRWRQVKLLAFLSISLALVWLVVILRVHPLSWYLPPARYAYPAISISTLAYAEGVRAVTARLRPKLFPFALFVWLLILGSAALFVQYDFYYGR